ncbi:hypothetical protein M885DRAFT_438298 [Pelagophyceae sp. CCMP2097]|nr:hypothetical protein M885DRAFT_438298 [Pelagophyceae sp. CCMP2097]
MTPHRTARGSRRATAKRSGPAAWRRRRGAPKKQRCQGFGDLVWFDCFWDLSETAPTLRHLGRQSMAVNGRRRSGPRRCGPGRRGPIDRARSTVSVDGTRSTGPASLRGGARPPEARVATVDGPSSPTAQDARPRRRPLGSPSGFSRSLKGPSRVPPGPSRVPRGSFEGPSRTAAPPACRTLTGRRTSRKRRPGRSKRPDGDAGGDARGRRAGGRASKAPSIPRRCGGPTRGGPMRCGPTRSDAARRSSPRSAERTRSLKWTFLRKHTRQQLFPPGG